jgi:hypothetical protein
VDVEREKSKQFDVDLGGCRYDRSYLFVKDIFNNIFSESNAEEDDQALNTSLEPPSK